MTSGVGLDPSPVGVRVKIAGLWTAMLFTFGYVDLFGLYRRDVRADLDAGKLAGFTVDQAFLAATTVYVIVPALVLVATLVVPAGVARLVNLVLSPLYTVSIIGGAVGEWGYYVLGSAVEVALLVAVAYYAWTWPRRR